MISEKFGSNKKDVDELASVAARDRCRGRAPSNHRIEGCLLLIPSGPRSTSVTPTPQKAEEIRVLIGALLTC